VAPFSKDTFYPSESDCLCEPQLLIAFPRAPAMADFTTVSALRPDTSGHNLVVKVSMLVPAGPPILPPAPDLCLITPRRPPPAGP
jgi:hypothetical protein